MMDPDDLTRFGELVQVAREQGELDLAALRRAVQLLSEVASAAVLLADHVESEILALPKRYALSDDPMARLTEIRECEKRIARLSSEAGEHAHRSHVALDHIAVQKSEVRQSRAHPRDRAAAPLESVSPPQAERTRSEPGRARSEDPLRGCKPRAYSLCGRRIELFGTGELATVLGRKPDTMRKWESHLILPPSQYRAPGRDLRGTRRLYTEKQLREIRRLAVAEGILQRHARPIKDTRFAERVWAMFRDSAVRTQKDAERHNSHCPAHDPKCVLVGAASNGLYTLLREEDNMNQAGSSDSSAAAKSCGDVVR
ncbi:hypothetical protein ACGFJC_39790 [Nonomuraea fuscirosea]|uniref:hypothetical protein n=1 Tax=Nonomuraea fuscirosea TaxID=1291556 RepID=UPI00371105A5